MTLGEVTVPMHPVGDGQAFIQKSQPLGRATPVEVLQVSAQSSIMDDTEQGSETMKEAPVPTERQPIRVM